MRPGDGFVVVLLAAVFVTWGYAVLRRWVLAPRTFAEQEPWTVEADDEIIVTDAVELLERSGYTVLTGKRKIPVTIRVDGAIGMKSRLFVDHFAERDDGIYVVKVARETRPLELDESGIREELLPYQLLYPEAEGVLYVDPVHDAVYQIQFDIELEEAP